VTPTVASASPAVELNARWKVSIASATPASDTTSTTFSLPAGNGRKQSQMSWSTTPPNTNAATIDQSTRDEIRPPGNPSTRAANGTYHQVATTSPSV
jgi:hypothetical protein